jgi:hypothetical protein
MSCVLGGKLALSSVEDIDTMWVIDDTRLYESSHASTRTLNGTPTVWSAGAPVLPDGVPGDADSPGSRTSIFVYVCACAVVTDADNMSAAAQNIDMINSVFLSF